MHDKAIRIYYLERMVKGILSECSICYGVRFGAADVFQMART